MKTSLFYLPSVGSRADIEAGMAGLRRDLYQQMLAELSEQARLADELGYDSISFTEHHFHIEGFELSNNPVLLDLFVGMQTTRLRVGQLGIVLPAHNPIRVAEDIAMLDHMTAGRANAGFARGYQRRWVDTMAQQTHGIHGALPHQHDAIDAANRAAFEENVRIIKQAWTQDLVDFQGDYWKVPVQGTPWDLEASTRYGQGIEDGMVRAVGVVPKPLQQPTRRCSNRSPRPSGRFAGAPGRASHRCCRRCTRRWSGRWSRSTPTSRAARSARASVCYATW